MNSKTREIVEIIGIFGIVGSLVFVGMQLVLDRRVATSAQFHARTILFQEQEQSVFENDAFITEMAQSWEDNRKPSWWSPEIEEYQRMNGYSMEYMARQSTQIRMRFIRLNDNYFQYVNGLISEESWEAILLGVRNNLSATFNRAVALSINTLEPGFKALMQELIAELDQNV